MADKPKDKADGGKPSGDDGAAKKEAQSVIAKAVDAMIAPISWMIPNKHLNAFLSLFNKWLVEGTAEKMVVMASGLIEKYPWVKNEIVLSCLNGLAAEIEDLAPLCKEPGARALVAKASDLLETIVPLVRNSGGTSRGMPVNPKVVEELAKRDAEFAAWCLNLRQHAKTPDERKAANEIIAETAAGWWEDKQLILHGPKAEPEQKEPGVPLRERFEGAAWYANEVIGNAVRPINRELGSAITRLQAHNQKLARENQRRNSQNKPTLVERFVKWLFA